MPRVFDESPKVETKKEQKKASPRTKKTTTKPKGIRLHSVDIIDGSGSMYGNYPADYSLNKFAVGVTGINEGIQRSIQSAEKEGIDTTFSVYQFGSDFNMNRNGNFTMVPAADMKDKIYAPKYLNGNTRLYGTIADVINYFIENKEKEDRVLLQIFTDGQENATESSHPYAKSAALAKLIKDAEDNHNFTITFMGTKGDVAYITRNININATNTIVHDNTREGTEKVYGLRANSTTMYMKRMASGEDVKANFFAGS